MLRNHTGIIPIERFICVYNSKDIGGLLQSIIMRNECVRTTTVKKLPILLLLLFRGGKN